MAMFENTKDFRNRLLPEEKTKICQKTVLLSRFDSLE